MKFFENKPALFLWLVVAFAGCAITLLFVTGESDQKFPVLPDGEYVGTVTDLFDEGELIEPLLIEVKGHFVSALLMRPGWSKIIVERHSDFKDSPLELSGPESRLRFSGSTNEEGISSGVVYDLDAGRKGKWSLNKAAWLISENTEDAIVEIKATALLRRELRTLVNEMTELRSALEKEKEGVSKLNEFMVDPKKVTERAAEKLKSVENQYATEEGEFRLKRREARELAKKLALSERVTETGSLVSLSRKTIERENRWLESIFETAGSLDSFDLDKEFSRAERITFLKTKISELRAELRTELKSE